MFSMILISWGPGKFSYLICWFCAERLTEVNNVLGMRCQEQEIEQNIFCKLHPILCGTTTSDQDRNINLSLSLASVVLPGSRTSEDGSPSFSECVYTYM